MERNTEQGSEILADRLNYEPVIFRGSTSSELMMIMAGAVAFWLPASLLGAGLAGALGLGVGIAAVGVLATVFFGSTLFQRVKRGRPDYYYQHRLAVLLDGLGLRKSGFISRGGWWDLGRDG